MFVFLYNSFVAYMLHILFGTTITGFISMLKKISLGLGLLLSSLAAQAEYVSLEDWWLTTDHYGGLRQSESAPDYYFAVAKSNSIDLSGDHTYEVPSGYRIATTEEGYSAFPIKSGSSYSHAYYNKGGWNGYSWEGTSRYYFLFSDSSTTGAYKHAGSADDYKVSYLNINAVSTSNLAGFVLVKDVPVPILLGAFGFALLGLSKRKTLKS